VKATLIKAYKDPVLTLETQEGKKVRKEIAELRFLASSSLQQTSSQLTK
jgi:hypothetical protein